MAATQAHLNMDTLLVNHLPIPCLFFHLDGWIFYANPAFKRLNIIDDSELIYQNIFSFTGPNQKSKFIKWVHALSEGKEPRVVSVEGDTMHINPKSSRPVKITVTPTGTGKPEKGPIFMATMEDISEASSTKKSLNKIQFELDQLFNLAVPSCVISKDHRLIRVNKTFCNLFNVDKKSAIGQKCYQVWKGPFCDISDCPLTHILEGKENFSREVELTLHNGKHITCILNCAPYKNFDGTTIGMVENFTDITERKELQKRKFELQKMESVGTLAVGIAHDFNNVLGAIMGFADKIENNVLNQTTIKRCAKIISQACERGGKLTERLMSFSRKNISTIEPTDIHELLDETTGILTHTLQKNIKIQREYSEHILISRCDPAQLQNVFLNMAANARDAMPHGGTLKFETGTCNLEKEEEIAAGNYITISISDTGCGIPEEELPHVFDPFFSTKGEKGTGFGLSTAYGCIKSHKGKLTIESKKSKGTKLTIYLPMVSDQIPISKNEKPRTPQRSPDSYPEILIVDDDQLLLNMYTAMMEDSNYPFQIFQNPQKAIAYFRSHYKNIGVVIQDMVMPEMNGETFFDAIKKIHPEAKVILLSGYAPSNEARSLIQKGARFISKPIRPKKLLAYLDTITAPDSEPSQEKPFQNGFDDLINVTSKNAEILIVDDDPLMGVLLRDLLSEKQCKIDVFQSSEELLTNFNNQQYKLAVVDYRLPGMDGLALIESLRKKVTGIKTVLLTGSTDHESVNQQAKTAKIDYFLKKPLDISMLFNITNQVFPHIAKSKYEQSSQYTSNTIVGKSAALKKVFDVIPRIAKSDTDLMIFGATGTGKELFAQAIHNESYRKDGPFITVNCPALPDSLLESELFGYEKGAFTGATQNKKGLFEWAHKGTFFMDEIGDLNIDLQAKLLRVIQERKIRRIGGKNEIDVDVRIISATNRNIEEMISKGKFREDLFYRLNVVRIELPSLNERIGDIPLLIEHFRNEFNAHERKQVTHISDDVISAFSQYEWPGNIRELKNTLYEMFILSESDSLSGADMPLKFRSDGHPVQMDMEQLTLSGYIEQMKKDYIKTLLRRYKGNIPKCSKHAQVNRTSFYHIMKKLEISPNEE